MLLSAIIEVVELITKLQYRNISIHIKKNLIETSMYKLGNNFNKCVANELLPCRFKQIRGSVKRNQMYQIKINSNQ